MKIIPVFVLIIVVETITEGNKEEKSNASNSSYSREAKESMAEMS